MSATAEATSIRPFRVEVPEGQLARLRRRVEATRWPSKELAWLGRGRSDRRRIERQALRWLREMAASVPGAAGGA
jgi:hypothetical protein